MIFNVKQKIPLSDINTNLKNQNYFQQRFVNLRKLLMFLQSNQKHFKHFDFQNLNKALTKISSFDKLLKLLLSQKLCLLQIKMIWDILQETGFNQYFQEPSIQTLTIQKLLLDENIITEFKNLNPKLIEFLEANRHTFVQKLIYYVIVLPKQNNSQDRIKKLPYVSSEVLAIDNEIVYKSLLDAGQIDYFAQLMKIFDSESSENQILLGYFVKIIQNLYKCQKKKTAMKIYQFRSTFYSHLNKQSVGTVLKLLLVILQTQDGFMLKQRQQVVQNIISQLIQQKDEDVKQVCTNILLQVIQKFQTFSSGDQLLKQILQSSQILKIFSQKQNASIDQFLIGYLSKTLQKICTTGDDQVPLYVNQKPLIQITEQHKQNISEFVKSKKLILTQHQQKSCFNNQSNKKVYRLDKNLSNYLFLVKLALQNGICGFFDEQDIVSIFKILSLHPSNDIIKVKIFQIFALIYAKKDEKSKQLFEKYFYSKFIELFEADKSMFGYFLYQLWRAISKKLGKQLKVPVQLIQRWHQVTIYFQMNEKYQKQAQKVVERYSNTIKTIKLVVDEEDSGANRINKSDVASNINLAYPVKSQQNDLQKTKNTIEQTNETSKQVAFKDSFSFDSFKTDISVKNASQSSIQDKMKADPFAAFQFGSFPTKKSQKKEEATQKADFSDFSSFF